MDTRLRIGRAIEKTEEEVAPKLMEQVKRHAPDEGPPALSTLKRETTHPKHH